MTHRLRRLLPPAFLVVIALALPASAAADFGSGFECCSTSGTAHSPSTATFSAAFMGQGTPTNVHFEYKEKGLAACDDGYQPINPGAYSFPGATKTPDQQIPGQGEHGSRVAFFSADVSGLTGGTTYCVTYFAQNANGSGYSHPNEFVAGAASASTDSFETTGPSTAVARGSYNAATQQTTYGVKLWGGTFSGCGATPTAEASATDPGTDGEFHPFELTLSSSGLTRGTNYAVQTFATNGSDSTPSCGIGSMPFGAPYAVIGSASNVTVTSATIANQINPGGGATSYTLGIDTAGSDFCASAHRKPAIAVEGTVPGAGFSRETVTNDVSGLTAATNYCWGLKASNDVTTQPADVIVVGHGTFRTADAPAADPQQGGNSQPQQSSPQQQAGGQPGGGGSPTPSVVLPTGLTGGSNGGTVTADKDGNVTLTKVEASCGIGPCTYNSTGTTSGAARKVTAAAKKKPKALKVAAGKQTLQTNATAPLTLKLNAAGKKLLKRKKTLVVSVKVTGKDAAGKTVVKTVKLKIKAAKRK